MSAEAIPSETEFVTSEELASHIAKLLRDNLAGGIYIEVADMPNEIVVVARGRESAGLFLLTIKAAEIRVAE